MTALTQERLETEYLSVLPQQKQQNGTDRTTIACVIPAYNEEDTIAEVLQALLKQSRLPNVIHVVVNNSTDETFYVAREFAGPHQNVYQDTMYRTEVFIHDIGSNKDKKVGVRCTTDVRHSLKGLCSCQLDQCIPMNLRPMPWIL